MPIYSIIIPVYKVEMYLPACIDSVLAQDTSSAYEIILVDDGSPDNSGAICDAYAAKHPQIRVLHKPNGGVSSARNAGLRAAEGEYVCFCDGDDLFAPEYLSTIDAFLPLEPDMVQVCARMFDENGFCGDLCPKLFPTAEGESGKTYLKRCLAVNALPMYGSYYYAIRRSQLLEHQVLFPENLSVNEDLDFILRCISAAKRICGTDRIVYLYRQHNASMVHTPSPEKVRMRLETTAKWFRIYPSSALADLVVMAAVSLPAVGTRSTVKELTAFCRQNRDIWAYTKDWRARFAAALFRVFGVYGGGHIYLRLIDFKHFLENRRTSI